MKLPLLFLLFGLQILALNTDAQAQCRRNAVDCRHGCGRHVDHNNDGFCDLGKLSATLTDTTKTATACTALAQTDTLAPQNQLAELSAIHQPPKDSTIRQAAPRSQPTLKRSTAQAQRPVSDTLRSTADSIAQSALQPQQTAQNPAQNPAQQPIVPPLLAPQNKEDEEIKQPEAPYDLFTVLLITLLGYGSTWLLERRKIMRKATHRRIWNLLLLATFLVSCLFGLFLVLQINYGIAKNWIGPLLFWHVEIGISMTLISIFHIFWHLQYFKSAFFGAARK